MAVALDSRQSRRIEKECGIPNLKGSLSGLAALLVLKQEDDARHSLPIEKVCDVSYIISTRDLVPIATPYMDDASLSKLFLLRSHQLQPCDLEVSSTSQVAWFL